MVNKALTELRYKHRIPAAHVDHMKMMWGSTLLPGVKEELLLQLQPYVKRNAPLESIVSSALDVFQGQHSEAQESRCRRERLGTKWADYHKRVLVDPAGEPPLH